MVEGLSKYIHYEISPSLFLSRYLFSFSLLFFYSIPLSCSFTLFLSLALLLTLFLSLSLALLLAFTLLLFYLFFSSLFLFYLLSFSLTITFSLFFVSLCSFSFSLSFHIIFSLLSCSFEWFERISIDQCFCVLNTTKLLMLPSQACTQVEMLNFMQVIMSFTMRTKLIWEW